MNWSVIVTKGVVVLKVFVVKFAKDEKDAIRKVGWQGYDHKVMAKQLTFDEDDVAEVDLT